MDRKSFVLAVVVDEASRAAAAAAAAAMGGQDAPQHSGRSGGRRRCSNVCAWTGHDNATNRFGGMSEREVKEIISTIKEIFGASCVMIDEEESLSVGAST